jgi:hypothetical protein
MKTKTIKKILTGKFLVWSRSIADESVRKLVEKNSIITGGAIVSLLENQEVNDFDVYFRDAETAYAVAQYYVKKLLENPPPTFKGDSKHKVEIYAKMDEAKEGVPARVRVIVKSAGIAGETKQTDYQYFEGIQDPNAAAQASEDYVGAAMGEFAEGQVTDNTEPDAHTLPAQEGYQKQVESLDGESATKLDDQDEKKRGKYRVLFVTSNAITLSDGMQLILRFQGEADVIHKNFDFQHCVSYWKSWDRELVLNPDALICIMTHELRYIGSRYPLSSIIRLRKFITRGWTVNAGQMLKMIFQVSQLDLNDVSVLEDQLVGVDSAYFSQLVDKLREQPDPTRVDGAYLATLIDKIF